MTESNTPPSIDEKGVIVRVKTFRRTITETDIVTFVNVMGMYDPPFVDMEYIKESMPESHQKRFAPGPFLISIGMGIMSTYIMGVIEEISEKEKLGLFMGMVGVDARIKAPAYPGDTLHVEFEASVQRKTSKGNTLVSFHHLVKKQTGDVVADFLETVMFSAPVK